MCIVKQQNLAKECANIKSIRLNVSVCFCVFLFSVFIQKKKTYCAPQDKGDGMMAGKVQEKGRKYITDAAVFKHSRLIK